MSSNGSVDPSWSEIKSFVKFLDIQIHDFEKSLLNVVDELRCFKDLFVTFEILMAKVCLICCAYIVYQFYRNSLSRH